MSSAIRAKRGDREDLGKMTRRPELEHRRPGALRMKRLTATLDGQLAKGAKLDQAVRENLKGLDQREGGADG